MHPVRGKASAASVYGIMQKEASSRAACFPLKLKELTIGRFKNYCSPILFERFQRILIVLPVHGTLTHSIAILGVPVNLL